MQSCPVHPLVGSRDMMCGCRVVQVLKFDRVAREKVLQDAWWFMFWRYVT
jgi:hypothetical protein